MSANRLQNRVAWDHTVLVKTAPRLEPRRSTARREMPVERGHPVAAIAIAWVLIAWSMMTAWALWTRSNADAHVSMRFLMRGDFEEVLGVMIGLGWACIPSGIAFFLARHTREATMDDLGGRAYWTSLAVCLIASLGILRPTWDANAGSRFARLNASPSPATQTSSVGDEGFDSSMVVPGADGMDPVAEPVPDPAMELAQIEEPAMVSHYGRSRLAALRALALQNAGNTSDLATVPTDGEP